MNTRTLIYLLLLAAAPWAALAQTTFTKVTTGPVVTAASSGGAAWVDFDGDGDLDLFVCNFDGANQLFRNEGSGVFTKVIGGTIVNAGPGSYSASWADFDNDGRIDLFIGRSPGPGLLFQQQANGTFVQKALTAGSCFGAAWADYDKDGFLDLIVAHDGQSLRWHNDGHGGLSPLASAPIDPSGDAIAWADFDNDGNIDVLVVEGDFTGGGNSRLYRNDGNGVFMKVTSGPLAQRSTLGTGAAWGDFDNDGFLDLFLARASSGPDTPTSFLFHNNGDGTFTQVEQSPFTADTGMALSCSWADYDNDGRLDLFVSENNGSVNRLYHNNSDGTFSRVLTGAIANDIGKCAGHTWGDYDRDGFLDLFVSVQGSPNYLYHNDGNGNAWITIKCVGTRSNRSAIGVKVRVKATIGGKTFWQLREINTGDGWAGVPLEAHFGLGDAAKVETLRIEWPSGAVQEFQNVAAKKFLTVNEPSRLVANGSRLTLQGGRNLLYDIQMSTDLQSWSLLRTLTITNLDGTALVAELNGSPSNRSFYRAVLR